MKEMILAPMAILMNLVMLSLFRILGNNRGEIDPNNSEPEPNPEPEPVPVQSDFDKLLADKGLKSPDEMASLYRKNESEYNRHKNIFETSKKQLEQHGYTYDEQGNVIQIQADVQQSNQQPYQQQQPYNQQQTDPIYDPYTGQQLTNPIDIQLAQMSPSQRMGVYFNVLTEEREKQQRDAYVAENEVLSNSSAKGFEDDVRKVMMQIPLANRAKKGFWQDALLRVKGQRYDDAIKNAGADGVQQFINKENIQSIPGSGGKEGTAKLSSDQEQSFQYYQKNHPGMFKDRAHFMKRLQPTG